MSFTPGFLGATLPENASGLSADSTRFYARQISTTGILTSENGLTWTLDPSRAVPGPLPSVNMNYLGGRFVSKTFGKIWSSIDGVTWAEALGANAQGGGSAGANASGPETWSYFQGLWILPSDADGEYFTSSDLNSFVTRSPPSGGSVGVLKEGPGYALSAIGENIYYTGNGITWDTYAFARPANYGNIAYGNGRWVCTRSFSTFTLACVSVDGGQTWVEGDLLDGAFGGITIFFDGVFVCLPASGSLGGYSTDGVTWTTFALPNASRSSVVANNIGLVTRPSGLSTNTAEFNAISAPPPPPPPPAPPPAFWTNFNRTRERRFA